MPPVSPMKGITRGARSGFGRGFGVCFGVGLWLDGLWLGLWLDGLWLDSFWLDGLWLDSFWLDRLGLRLVDYDCGLVGAREHVLGQAELGDVVEVGRVAVVGRHDRPDRQHLP